MSTSIEGLQKCYIGTINTQRNGINYNKTKGVTFSKGNPKEKHNLAIGTVMAYYKHTASHYAF